MASSHTTPVVRPPARTVVLLGPEDGGDVAALAGAVAARGDELVVLATGWPVTPAQQEVIHEAMRAAADLRLTFEAHLLSAEEELEDHLLPGDRLVSLATSGLGVRAGAAAGERPVPSFA